MSYSICVGCAVPINHRGDAELVVLGEGDDIFHEEGISIDQNTDNAKQELLALIEGLHIC